jgi:mono/diheme cytochrome c family protein
MKGLLPNMKHLLKSTLVIAGIFLTVNLITPTRAARPGAYTVSPSVGTAPSADTLYKQKCAKCHGADGSGDTSLGRISNAPDFTDVGWWAKHPNPAERVNTITRGKKSMPAFGKKLTKAQITSLATYVQKFKR